MTKDIKNMTIKANEPASAGCAVIDTMEYSKLEVSYAIAGIVLYEKVACRYVYL